MNTLAAILQALTNGKLIQIPIMVPDWFKEKNLYFEQALFAIDEVHIPIYT